MKSSRHTLSYWPDAARVLALAATSAQQDARLPDTERLQLADRYAARSVALLAHAAAGGFFLTPTQLHELTKAPDFASLPAREDFKELVRSLVAKGKSGAE